MSTSPLNILVVVKDRKVAYALSESFTNSYLLFKSLAGHYCIQLEHPFNETVYICHTVEDYKSMLNEVKFDLVMFAIDRHDVSDDMQELIKRSMASPGVFKGGMYAMTQVKSVGEILECIRMRSLRGNPDFYKRLCLPESEVIQDFYRASLDIPEEGHLTARLINKKETLISIGYTRIVIGDYGAYVEMSPEQVNLDGIKLKWANKPKRPVKYLWMITKDSLKTKVYHQQGTVAYADYISGMYYVNVEDITLELSPEDQVVEDLLF